MPVVEIIIIVCLILLNGLLAMSELALVSSRRARLEAMAEGGSRGARVALALLDDPTAFLSTVQIGITLVGIVAGAFGGATLADSLGDRLDLIAWIAPNGDTVAIAIVVVAITYLSLVAGELVPKRIALTNPERTAAFVAVPMRLLALGAFPAVWLLRRSTEAVLRLLGHGGARQTTITEDEVKSLIAEGTRAGVFAPEERAMIDGVLRLADRTVRAIMTPRSEIDWVDVGADRKAVIEVFRGGRYTQLLACEGSIDRAVGLLDARDVLTCIEVDFRVAELVRQVPFIPEQTPVLRLIDRFRKSGVHFAVIVDEYGSTEGVVTAIDVLESIAGYLPERGEPADPMVVERAEGSWLVDGMMPIDEFEALIGIRGLAEAGDYVTVAGFVIDQFGRLPVTGDRLVRPDMVIEVVDMDGRRIDKLAVSRPAEP